MPFPIHADKSSLNLLSIVLPTILNRPVWLYKKLFHSLLHYSTLGVEVCIFFNTPINDSNAEAFHILSALTTNFVISDVTLSIDYSLLNACKLSTKPYIWQIGDDDIPNINQSNAISYLLSADTQVDFIYMKSLPTLFSHMRSRSLLVTGVCNHRAFVFPISIFSFFNLLGRELCFGSFICNSSLLISEYWRPYMSSMHAYGLSVIHALYHSVRHRSFKFAFLCPSGLSTESSVPKTWSNRAFGIHFYHIPLGLLVLFYNCPKLFPSIFCILWLNLILTFKLGCRLAMKFFLSLLK